jgi:hypothetical protein
VAWLTSPCILEALATRKAVSIVVQKEDFLRPDITAMPEWKAQLHALYENLKFPFQRFQVDSLMGLSFGGDPTVQAIRCVGNRNSDKTRVKPHSHHKFIVGCIDTDEGEEGIILHPVAVWTGSFNFSKNAVNSFENAVVLTNRVIAEAFYGEWAQVIALSEPLDWESEWCAPEWRIGS